MPEYYRHALANGKTVMETAPTIQWGYLIYLTVLRLCQYFGAKEECRLLRHQPQLAPAQAGGPPVHRRQAGRRRARGARADRPLRHRPASSKAYTLTGGSVTSTVDGLAEADFYGRYAQAIEERFPGRWIGKVVAQALPKADVQRYKDYGITIYHPNYEVWDKRLFEIISPGQGALRRPRGVAPPDLRRGRGVRRALRDPELRRRRRDGEAVRLRDGRRGDRVDDGGARLLHEPRDHPALHDLVPRADDAARPRQPRRARRSSTTSACSRPTARRSRSHGLKPPPGYGVAGAGNAVFSVSSFMDTLAPEEVTVEEAVPA